MYEILSSITDLYCNRLDPQAFWLTRQNIDELVREPSNCLLKYLLIDSCLRMSNLSNEEIQCLSCINGNIEHLAAETNNVPSINGVIALAFLTSEEIMKCNTTLAKIYMGRAFRLADMLGINPEQPSMSPFGSIQEEQKRRVWESLLLLQGFLFCSTPGITFGKYCSSLKFSHVSTRELTFPIIGRVLKTYFSNSNTLFREFNRLYRPQKEALLPFTKDILVQKIRTLPGPLLKFYTEAVSIFMDLFQHSLSLRRIPYTYLQATYSYIFIPESKRTCYLSKLEAIIDQLPVWFKEPKTLSFNEVLLNLLSNPKESKNVHLGNFIYLTLLSNIVFINYPLVWVDPKPLSLPDITYWNSALSAARRIFDFSSAYFKIYLSEDEPQFFALHISNLSGAICIYLNAIQKLPFIDQATKLGYRETVQLFVNELLGISRSPNPSTAESANESLKEMYKVISNFDLSPLEPINIE
ncbi:hypothetical protein DSO57_1029075 [Entomophthora muscae]|uniref:Uncharacterized protein n=1 Tax=Entomophthora muscae TaxID=34485 RepID=A0ACC2UAP8_9FUNG|nr:hypothetical protein DSO57_1029075 [Entomophthora muscae]